ncbi:Protein kinase domain-containing protein, partial [Streptosporangium subroseum]
MLGWIQSTCTVRVLGSDAAAAQPWLATEYVPGPTLAHRIADNGPLSEQELLGLAAGLGEGLRALHAAGVIHRDLKPSNVILSPTGPRLVDMGIARALDETSVTRTGVVVGTPGWISPEEYRGDDIGPATDVYGWALLTLFAASGRAPFGTGRPEVLAMRVLTDVPDTDPVPEQLASLVAQALSKDPAERPSSVHILEPLAQSWRTPDATRVEDITQFLDRTWVMPLHNDPEWIVPTRPRRLIPLIAASATIAIAGTVITITTAMSKTESANTQFS